MWLGISSDFLCQSGGQRLPGSASRDLNPQPSTPEPGVMNNWLLKKFLFTMEAYIFSILSFIDITYIDCASLPTLQ